MRIHVDFAHPKLVAQRKGHIVVEKIVVEINHSW